MVGIKTMAVMTRDVAEHFYEWLEKYVAIDEQHEVEELIHRLARNEPWTVDGSLSWREVRHLAETLEAKA
jgi:hypothetical protein